MIFRIVPLFYVFVYHAHMPSGKRSSTGACCYLSPVLLRRQRLVSKETWCEDGSTARTLLLLIYTSGRRGASSVSNSLLITSSQETFASCCLFLGWLTQRRLNGFHLTRGRCRNSETDRNVAFWCRLGQKGRRNFIFF